MPLNTKFEYIGGKIEKIIREILKIYNGFFNAFYMRYEK